MLVFTTSRAGCPPQSLLQVGECGSFNSVEFDGNYGRIPHHGPLHYEACSSVNFLSDVRLRVMLVPLVIVCSVTVPVVFFPSATVPRVECGSSGGVVVYFGNVEVVYRLQQAHILEVVREYSPDFQTVLIVDRVRAVTNAVCAKFSLQEVSVFW
jgi:hypothetical protein